MKLKYLPLAVVVLCTSAFAQAPFNPDTVKAGQFDNGKMWTFDFPPKDYFEKTYQFEPTQEWFDAMRMSALRFASWCSASFVSADGLVMTNHHCSRDVALGVQKEGENFLNEGFYAKTLADERRVPDLFVDQLIQIEDITERVRKAFNKGKTDVEKLQFRETEFEEIKKEYAQKEGWIGLELQPVTLYQGARYSLYGFKRYNDVRLVLIPELALGFFGGDYDNFTYPRYSLDFTFFRVYDESGQPFKPKYYFKFNPNGIEENEPVFVIGNPGKTDRQATVAMLEYFRDVQYPAILDRYSKRSEILAEYNETADNDSIRNVVFGYENALKAYGGQLDGLLDPYIIARRAAFEREFQHAVSSKPGADRPEKKTKASPAVWNEIAKTQDEIEKIYYDATLFAPVNGLNSRAFDMATLMNVYSMVNATDAKRGQALKDFLTRKHNIVRETEVRFLNTHIKEANKYFGINDRYVSAMLQYGNPDVAAKALIENTQIYDVEFRKALLDKGPEAIAASDDPLLAVTRMAASRYESAQAKLKQLNSKMASLRSTLGRMLYDAYGLKIPPDATFSLRIADGLVKPYEYNGTKAPILTTYYGMYDRYYSFEGEYPWNLPEKWKNPSSELLKAPINFVSTNDIIGGNSGSPLVNRNLEVVGLVFDSNMEGLPGDYIYLPESARTVSVHAGGILAGLKYIYKADRIASELIR